MPLTDIKNIDSKRRKVVSNTKTDEASVEENELNEYIDDREQDLLHSSEDNQPTTCSVSVQREMNGEELESLQTKLKRISDEMERLTNETEQLKKQQKRLDYELENQSFDISRFKDSDKDIEFYTGLPRWDALMLVFNMLYSKAQNLNYGNYTKKEVHS